MLPHIAGYALKLDRHIPNFLGRTVLFQQLDKGFFLFKGFFKGDAHLKRDELRHLISEPIRLVLNPRYISNHRLCGHGTEGDDLRDRFSTIGICHIFDHLIAAIHTEINVKVGHRYTLGIQKSLKQQIVGQGVDICNLQNISN